LIYKKLFQQRIYYMMTETNTSYYIPRVQINTSIEEVLNEFGLIGLGTPIRVDFVYLSGNNTWKSAFVHCLPDITETSMGIYAHIQGGNSYRWHFHNNQNKKYWIILKTKNTNHFEPVKNLESDKIAKLEEKVQHLRHVVYQLVTGLYCPITQMRTLNTYIDILYPEFQSNDDITIHDTSRWRSRPTTQQSDDCERRIGALEERVNAFSINYINNDTNYDIDDNDLSVSTHSSMPSLISMDDDNELSVSTHSSMPSLVSASSDSDSDDDNVLTILPAIISVSSDNDDDDISTDSDLTWLQDAGNDDETQ